jgi:hypothetical protein
MAVIGRQRGEGHQQWVHAGTLLPPSPRDGSLWDLPVVINQQTCYRMYDEGVRSYNHKETRRCLVVVVAGAAAKQKGEDLAQQGLDC